MGSWKRDWANRSSSLRDARLRTSRGAVGSDGDAWLRGRWEKERVLDVLDGLLRARGVTVESPTLARKALEGARNGAVGFADHLIAEMSFDASVKEIITFDRAFGRLSRVRRLS